MRALVTWLVLAVAGYGALAAGYHFYLESAPRRLAVVVDTSKDMERIWPRVHETLDTLAQQPYTEFSLFTVKSRVHGWSSRFRPGQVTPYGPRDFERLEALAESGELAEADEIVLLTNAPASRTVGLPGWRIERLEP